MKVFLSPLAVDTFESILEFIEEKWSRKSRDQALEKVLSKFNQISTQPRSCPESNVQPNVFKCVVTKQTSFFYRILKEEIEIIFFYDNRQKPDDIVRILRRNKS